MASRPNIEQHFEDAIGIDYVSSDLKRPKNAFKALKNFVRGKGRSLRGRIGCQNLPPGGFLGWHNYTYQDLTTGAAQEEVVAINDHLWRLKTGTLSITGGTNLNHKVSLNVATSTYRFVISNNSTPYTLSGNPYFDLGSGVDASLITVEALRASIDAHASLVCARPASLEFAQVNGTQNNVSVITVFAGHTLAVGDYIQFWDFSSNKLVWRIITATTATTLTFDSAWGTVSVQANQILGPLGTTAASIAVNDAYVTSSGSLDLNFYYWDPVQHVTGKYAPFGAFWASRNHASWRHAHFLNADNKVYIFTESPGQTPLGHEGYPHYYDGVKVARAGVPKITRSFILSSGAGTVPAGTYKFKARYAKRDANGVTYYGQPDDLGSSITLGGAAGLSVEFFAPRFSSGNVATVNGNQVGVSTIVVNAGHKAAIGDTVLTVNVATGDYHYDVVSSVDKNLNTITISTAISVNNTQRIFLNSPMGFDERGQAKNAGASANVSTVTLAGTQAPFRIGDTVNFLDTYISTVAAPAALQSRKLTAASATSITWSGTTANFVGGDRFSACMWVEIYRTTNGGNKYYLHQATPVHPNDESSTTPLISLTDAQLVANPVLDEPEINFELDLPPRAAIGCLHQGVMIYSRISGEPNSVGYSDINGGLEAVPLASNYFDVPSNVQGAISAIASDDDSRLAIFKPRAFYDYQGDVTSGAISGRAVCEGDYGISSQASITKIDGVIVGIGPLGPIAISQGQRDESFAINIRPAFKDNKDINVNRAVAANDNTSERFLCWIPPSTAGSGKQLMFMYDYGLDNQWFDWSYTEGYDPGGGMVVYNSNLYHLSLASINGFGGRPFRRHELLTDVTQRYADNHTLIPYQIRTQPHHDNSPSIDKVFKALKLFSLYSQFDSSDFTPCTWSIKTFRNFQEVTPHTQTQKSFAASTDFELTVSLQSGKATALQLLLENTAILQCPHLTGYELLFGEPYAHEDIKRR